MIASQQPQSNQFRLQEREVHLWLTETQDYSQKKIIPRITETERQLKFHRQLSRALCRHVLSRYSGIDALEIAFEYNRNGKPKMIQSMVDFNFNISHTHHYWAIAISQQKVGLDLEVIRNRPFERLVKRVFNAKEQDAFYQAKAEMKADCFFRTWTRKEALLKAAGLGVFVEPQAADTISERIGDETWYLNDLDFDGQCIGALATQSPEINVKRFSKKIF